MWFSAALFSCHLTNDKDGRWWCTCGPVRHGRKMTEISFHNFWLGGAAGGGTQKRPPTLCPERRVFVELSAAAGSSPAAFNYPEETCLNDLSHFCRKCAVILLLFSLWTNYLLLASCSSRATNSFQIFFFKRQKFLKKFTKIHKNLIQSAKIISGFLTNFRHFFRQKLNFKKY